MWIFFIFWTSKIRVSLTDIVSSLSLPAATSPLADVTTSPHYITLSSHRAKTSLLHPLHLPTMLHLIVSPSRAETEPLKLHYHHWPPSSDNPTPTIHCYKKIILILVTLPTTQVRLHFASSLARAPRHWSFTRRHRSLSLPSHVHRPSAQRHS
jgi:hypothetical protein